MGKCGVIGCGVDDCGSQLVRRKSLTNLRLAQPPTQRGPVAFPLYMQQCEREVENSPRPEQMSAMRGVLGGCA
jgi:hypothetical protein